MITQCERCQSIDILSTVEFTVCLTCHCQYFYSLGKKYMIKFSPDPMIRIMINYKDKITYINDTMLNIVLPINISSDKLKLYCIFS